MIIKVTYNKNTQELTVEGDVTGIELNTGTIQDTSDTLDFEIAVDTTQYEINHSDFPLDTEIE